MKWNMHHCRGRLVFFSASSEKSVEKQKSERKQRKFVCEAPPPTGENKRDNLTDRSSLWMLLSWELSLFESEQQTGSCQQLSAWLDAPVLRSGLDQAVDGYLDQVKCCGVMDESALERYFEDSIANVSVRKRGCQQVWVSLDSLWSSVLRLSL